MSQIVFFVHGSAEMYGSDKVLLNLVTGLVAQGKFLPVVVLHEHGPLQAALAAAGVESHVASVTKISRKLFGPRAPWWLWKARQQTLADFDRIAADRDVAVVYSNTLAVLGGAFWSRWRRLPHVWHVHEIIQQPALVRKGLPWLANKLSTRLVTNSRQTQAWMISQAPQLVAKAEVIFNGLPSIPIRDDAAVSAFRRALGLVDDEVLVTVAGRLNHWKGQNLLIDAYALLLSEGKAGRIRLAIVGDSFAGHDDWLAKLQHQVEALGLQARVFFLPFTDDIYTVWNASEIAVVPSLEPEPFGMVAIEAMACQVPVIAAGHGGLLDIVEPGVTGLLFAPRQVRGLADAIHELSTDAELRKRMGAAGARRQADLFSLDSQVAATQRLCLELVAK
jgi:glycosyltransferase involved in cell wall biosynthesis